MPPPVFETGASTIPPLRLGRLLELGWHGAGEGAGDCPRKQPLKKGKVAGPLYPGPHLAGRDTRYPAGEPPPNAIISCVK